MFFQTSGERLGLPIVPVKEVEQPEKIYATLNEIREKLGVTKFKGKLILFPVYDNHSEKKSSSYCLHNYRFHIIGKK